jgi:hypothetical protein
LSAAAISILLAATGNDDGDDVAAVTDGKATGKDDGTDASTATPSAFPNAADVACPPSPLEPYDPVPATVLMTPFPGHKKITLI